MIRLSPPHPHPDAPRDRAYCLVAAVALTTFGCSVQAEESVEDASVGAVHAVVQVRRVELYDNQPHGDALAAFVRIPAGTNTTQLLNVAGLWPRFPETGQCDVDRLQFEPASEQDGSAELLSAEAVELRTPEGLHRLAPHAFPSAYDLLRGVVYSSRDQLARDLPENSTYVLAGYGIESNEDQTTIELRSPQLSPSFPTGVRVLEQPFEEITSVPDAPVIDFSWQGSQDSRDYVVIALRTRNLTYRCSFEDREGFGSVPLILPSGEAVWPLDERASVSVHRIRSSFDAHPDFAQVAVGFDFSIEKTWTISEVAPLPASVEGAVAEGEEDAAIDARVAPLHAEELASLEEEDEE